MKLFETKRTTPYPTIQCLLREVALAFDTKSYLSDLAAKKLDGQCKKLEMNIHEYESLKQATVIEPIRKVFNDEVAARITIFLRLITTRYFKWIEEYPLDGLSVSQANDLFQRTQFFECLIFSAFLTEDKAGILGLPSGTSLLLNDSDASNEVIKELGNKDAKDTFHRWLSGKYQPSFKYVENLDQQASGSKLSVTAWNNIKWGLIASRFINYFDPDYSNKTITTYHMNAFKITHSKNAPQFIHIKHTIEAIFNEFRLKANQSKTEEDKSRVDTLLAFLLLQIKKANPDIGIEYVYHQLNARHLVLSGELDKAFDEYKLAFKTSLYRAHSKAQIQLVIKEALLVAANQKSPKRVFITQLKSYAILLGLDDLPARSDEDGKNRDPVLYNNEIEVYRQEFHSMFPEKLAYPCVKYPKYEKKVGMVFHTDENNNEKNLKKKKIKIGYEGGVQRATTPLIDATTKNEVELAIKLIDEGASINVTSEVGDSPLLMALTQLDFQSPLSSMDDRLFWLISNKKHSDSILNTVTTRKMRFPLYAAIETGNPAIVKKVLSMSTGIDVNLRGGLDYMSPLYQTLCILGFVKKPSELYKRMFGELSEETIHRLKPMFAGFGKTSSKEIHDALQGELSGEPWQSNLRQAWQAHFMESFNKRSPTPSLIRQISRILILGGANLNLEHNINGMKYTPLMLTAEMDELKLFKLMIKHGGNWEKVYVIPSHVNSEQKAINCLHIAKSFGSKSIAYYIEHELM